MAIYAPGKRDRHNRPLKSGKRSAVVILSLTAMVDMFTVLVVFLLQNYNTDLLEINDEVPLPKANAVKELKPAHVVVVSKESIKLDKDVVASFVQVKEQQDWTIEALNALLKQRFQESAEKRNGLGSLRAVVEGTKPGVQKDDPADDRRVTVQADKSIDFLTIKKVLNTVINAGASEVNFAVVQEGTQKN